MILRLLQALSATEDGLRSWLGEDLMHSKTLLLYLLLDLGEMSPSRLAEEMGLSRGRMSHLLDDMEKDDLLQRKPDPGDGRSFIIALTPEGRGQAEKARALVVGLEAKARGHLGDAGFAMLVQQLEEFACLKKEEGDQS